MILCEARDQLAERLAITDYKEQIPEYYKALEIAIKRIDAQIYLCEVLNDFWDGVKEGDTFSAKLVEEILINCRYDKQEG